MNWIWLNMPLAAVIFGAVTGIPLWMVIKHPDTGTAPRAASAAKPSRHAVLRLRPASATAEARPYS